MSGITGISGRGAVSIVYSGAYSGDADKGEEMWYSGTNSKDSDPTAATNLMLESEKRRNVVRVIRSSNGKSPYKPQKGLRYDGLYKIVSSKLVEDTLADYIFHLRREKNQTPIRYKGTEARPTGPELAANEEVDALLKQVGN
jgi:hypothetical protein